MAKLKNPLLTQDDLESQIRAIVRPNNQVWYGKGGEIYLIEAMDFQHLENIVNYFSQEGTTVDPSRQGAFENVMLRYLRLQAEINDVHKDIL
jgi:UTP-glucose-1-phosphate uridylyltransferase